MSRLHQIQLETQQRAVSISMAHPAWPCHKGCSDCCQRLASEPEVSRTEWTSVAAAINARPDAVILRERIREAGKQPRPVTCGLLDRTTGACLIYDARPIACRSYGFYAERDKVLGCQRIEAISSEATDVIWGNHATLDQQLAELGATRGFSEWLDSVE